ncbi:nonstructural protein [robinz microvirus RP_34]|nr:nonstructural protein [robinz microvirus RP_34]
MNGYSLYDRKTLSYGVPFFATTDGAAVRSLTDLTADTNTIVAQHPGDFVLFLVGRFAPTTGELLPITPAQHVCDALSVAPESRQSSMDFSKPNGTAKEVTS